MNTYCDGTFDGPARGDPFRARTARGDPMKFCKPRGDPRCVRHNRGDPFYLFIPAEESNKQIDNVIPA